MNNIWLIFKRDLRKIATNSMAIILAAGVLVLFRSLVNRLFLYSYDNGSYSRFPESLGRPLAFGDNYVVPYNLGNAAYQLGNYREAEDCFAAGVRMPPAREIAERELGFGDMRGKLPLVRMEGIAHLMLTPELVFFALLRDGEAAGRAARAWADELSAEALGLMFLETAAPQPRLTPLVCVPGSGTLFWERSCASGSAAAGAYLASLTGTRAELTLREPGGSLRVESEADGETWLFGRTRLLESCEEEFVL